MTFEASNLTIDGSWRVMASWDTEMVVSKMRRYGGHSLLPYDFGDDEQLCRAVAADMQEKHDA